MSQRRSTNVGMSSGTHVRHNAARRQPAFAGTVPWRHWLGPALLLLCFVWVCTFPRQPGFRVLHHTIAREALGCAYGRDVPWLHVVVGGGGGDGGDGVGVGGDTTADPLTTVAATAETVSRTARACVTPMLRLTADRVRRGVAEHGLAWDPCPARHAGSCGVLVDVQRRGDVDPVLQWLSPIAARGLPTWLGLTLPGGPVHGPHVPPGRSLPAVAVAPTDDAAAEQASRDGSWRRGTDAHGIGVRAQRALIALLQHVTQRVPTLQPCLRWHLGPQAPPPSPMWRELEQQQRRRQQAALAHKKRLQSGQTTTSTSISAVQAPAVLSSLGGPYSDEEGDGSDDTGFTASTTMDNATRVWQTHARRTHRWLRSAGVRSAVFELPSAWMPSLLPVVRQMVPGRRAALKMSLLMTGGASDTAVRCVCRAIDDDVNRVFVDPVSVERIHEETIDVDVNAYGDGNTIASWFAPVWVFLTDVPLWLIAFVAVIAFLSLIWLLQRLWNNAKKSSRAAKVQ